MKLFTPYYHIKVIKQTQKKLFRAKTKHNKQIVGFAACYQTQTSKVVIKIAKIKGIN